MQVFYISVHQNYTVFNYDKDTGFSLFDAFKPQKGLNESSLKFVDKIQELKKTGKIDTKDLDVVASKLGNVNVEVLNAAKAAQTGKKSWDDYETVVAKTSSTTSKFSKATSTLKNVGGMLGSSLLNAGIGMLAGVAIQGVVTLIDNYIHRQEKMIAKGKEAKSSIDETFAEFSKGKNTLDTLGQSFADNADDIETTGDAIESVAKKYSELSKNVDTVTNKNKGLSSEEYQQYLDISNQLASQFPSLVEGYDSQGNAILNLGSNADSAAASLKSLYDAQMLSANVKIGEGLQDAYTGTIEQIKQYKDENAGLQKQIDLTTEAIEKQKAEVPSLDVDNNNFEFDPAKLGDKAALKNYNSLVKAMKELKIGYQEFQKDAYIDTTTGELMQGAYGVTITSATDKQLQDLKAKVSIMNSEVLDSLYMEKNEAQQKMAANELLIKDEWKSMTDSLGQYLQTNKTFTDLNKNLQDVLLGNLENMNSSMVSEKYGGDVKQFLYSELLQPVSKLKPEMQQKLTDLLQIDPKSVNLGAYKNAISNTLKEAFPNNKELQKSFKSALGLDEVIEESEDKLNVLKLKYGEIANKLSLDDIENGYDLVVNDKFSGTFDELQEKIKQSKALASTGIDIEANPKFDAIGEADKSKNKGDDYVQAKSYLDQAKEMYDKGLVGTDDFKTRAAYLSPTGAEDAVNFAENYAKAARYLTEDASGVHNFLNDLERKGMAFKTVADGTEQWTYNINDLEKAASDMGIGFEMFMDMFGRLEDYGFSNNFVGSVEQGTQRITDLSSELVSAKAELARLQAEGADSTAIEQQTAKVHELESSLQQTQNNLGQLMNKSVDDYNQQVESAKTAFTSLKQERDKILSENTYGENTDEVVSLMDEQLRKLAQENGLTLDANLNIVNEEELRQEIENYEPFSLDFTDEDTLSKLDETVQKFNELSGNNLSFDFATDDLHELSSQIYTIAGTFDQFKTDGKFDFSIEGASEAASILQSLLYRREQLLQPTVMEISVPDVSEDLQGAVSIVQELQAAVDDLQVKQGMQAHGIDVDTTAAESKIQELAGQLKGLDEETTAKLGLDTQEVQSALDELAKPHEINATISQSAISSIENAFSGIDGKSLGVNVDYEKGKQEPPSRKTAKVDYEKGKQEAPSEKTAKVNYTLGDVAKPPDATVKVHYDTSDKPKGASPANGTAHSQGTASSSSGHAFSGGSWGLKQPEKGALINELGAEIIVRNGQWFVENYGYPTITNLKKDDIVFNHEQSKALLERGYVTGSHAKLAYEGSSHAIGTAFANGSGGGSFGVGGSGSQSGIAGVGSNLNSASNNLSKAASDTSEAAEKLSEAVSGYTDWVEVLFKRLESQYDLLMSQMERIAHLPFKQEKLYEAMSKNSELMNKTQQAMGVYQNHFNSVVSQGGLNPTIVSQIQNGSLDISKYDQETQKIISEAQSWYDKLQDCNKQYDDLLNKQSELTKKALENIEDYIDMMTGIESSAVDYQEALRELAAAKGESAYSDNMYSSLQESIKNQQDVAGKLQSQVQLYQDEINKLMENGSMAKWSTEWYEAQAALNGFKQEAAEAEKTLIDLKDQLQELNLLKLQQVIDELDRTAKRLENNSSLTESKGEQVSEEELQKQIDNANAQIQANYNKRNELLKEQAKYDVGSDKYNEIAKEIEGLDDAIFDAMENIEELKNKIWEVRWKPFFDGQEALDDLIKQTDDLRGLLDDEAFLDKNGGLTIDGIANIALISQGMNAAKQQIKNYQEALKKLDEDLKNGNISTEEYEEQQKEFMDGIANSVGVVEDYKDSIVDLYKKQLEAENDMVQKSIDKFSELLDIKKKNAEYSKNLRKQTKDINVLKAQIAALEGVKLFARLLFNCGDIPTTLSCYNGTGNGKRECGTS